MQREVHKWKDCVRSSIEISSKQNWSNIISKLAHDKESVDELSFSSEKENLFTLQFSEKKNFLGSLKILLKNMDINESIHQESFNTQTTKKTL